MCMHLSAGTYRGQKMGAGVSSVGPAIELWSYVRIANVPNC